jgi:hypothetical protein
MADSGRDCSAVKNVAVGDEIIGFTHNRASQAELVVVEAVSGGSPQP